MAAPLLLGIDGGGTSCRARLTDADGAVLGSGLAGPASTRFGVDASLVAVMAAARAALAEAGLDEADIARTHAGIGIAGIGRRGAREAFAGWRHPFASARFESDAWIACRGAHGGGDGGIVVVGTGSVGLAIVGERVVQVGGYGFPVSDEGSGAALGLAAVQAALRAHDGRVPASPLLREVMARFHDLPAEVVAWMDRAGATDYAALAPMVIRNANTSDSAGRQIVQHAAADLDAIARVLTTKGAPRLALLGGLSSAIEEWLAPDVRRCLSAPLGDALAGALSLAAVALEANAGG